MIIKASGRSALILAAGLFVLLASPVRAATDGDDAATEATPENPAAAQVTPHRIFRHTLHHRRSYAHRKSPALAMKADTDNKKAAATEVTSGDRKVLAEIPPSVANANAQMLLAGAQISAAAALPAGTDIPAMAPDNAATTRSDNETILVAADQLNDVDKALRENNNAPPATGNPPSAPAAAMTNDNSVWDQTSLIGKVFIGFGALLTMASAARMFMA
jgi:hypothetical protein